MSSWHRWWGMTVLALHLFSVTPPVSVWSCMMLRTRCCWTQVCSNTCITPTSTKYCMETGCCGDAFSCSVKDLLYQWSVCDSCMQPGCWLSGLSNTQWTVWTVKYPVQLFVVSTLKLWRLYLSMWCKISAVSDPSVTKLLCYVFSTLKMWGL